MSITSADRAFPGLTKLATVEIDSVEYVVYSDGAYTTAISEGDWAMVDTDTYGPDAYSEWCATYGGVSDEALCSRIAAGAGLDGIYTAGSCIWAPAVAPASLSSLIAHCEEEWRKQGAEGDIDLTADDCDWITDTLGRKPSREEWADAGLPHVGSRHVADEAS